MKSLAMLALVAAAALASNAYAKDIPVDNAKDIKAAMASAQAGDVISIKPGDYEVDQLQTGNSGTKDQPITLQASGDRGYAKLKITGGSDVGFRVISKHWKLYGLHIVGNPAKTLDLIQIDATRGGSDLYMVDCKISTCREFLIKSSRSREKGPENVVLDHCEWFDCPETAIDLVSSDNWIIRGNYLHDWGKGGGTHYGMFLKGGGKNGIIEGNFVDGKAGKGSIGISFGGGLTGPKWLPLAADGKVGPEHTGGIARNNIVVNTADCAYHTNNGSDCKFYNNLAYNCGAGFQRQANYPPEPTLINNVFCGGIKGAGKNENNLTKVDKAWFLTPDAGDFRLSPAGVKALAGKGQALADNPTDYFGTPRKPGAADLGPVIPDAKVSTKWVDRRAMGLPPGARPVPTTPTATTPTATDTPKDPLDIPVPTATPKPSPTVTLPPL